MQYYEKYVVIERLRKKVTCGEINLPYGTECYTIYHGDEKAIMCDKGLVCYVSSKTAYKHFAQNDDGNGLERGRLTKSIIARLKAGKVIKVPDARSSKRGWLKSTIGIRPPVNSS